MGLLINVNNSELKIKLMILTESGYYGYEYIGSR